MSKYKRKGETNENSYSPDDLNDRWIIGEESNSYLDNDVDSIFDGLDEDSSSSAPKKKQKIYWTTDTEEAIVQYLYLDEDFLLIKLSNEYNSKNPSQELIKSLEEKLDLSRTPRGKILKDKIFTEKINKPINRLIENIIFNFKLFIPGVDVKTQIHGCLSFLMTKFPNFEPDINKKAYSFFGTISKHYLMGEKKDFYKETTNNVDYDIFHDEADSVETTEMHEEIAIEESLKFFNYVIDVLQREIDKNQMSQNDIKVADAIVQIFKYHEYMGHYSKNLLYQDIKEATGLQTKDITYSLSRLKVLYKLNKQSYIKKKMNVD